ncbi:MAG: hypothetical protein ACXVII_42485 [Solirubrobacteraceae bacterium]
MSVSPTHRPLAATSADMPPTGARMTVCVRKQSWGAWLRLTV